MQYYRIFVGAFPGGEIAGRIQAVRQKYDPKTASFTLAGTYWRSGPATSENEAATIARIEITPGLLAARQAFLEMMGSDKHHSYTPHLAMPALLPMRTPGGCRSSFIRAVLSSPGAGSAGSRHGLPAGH